MTTLTKKVKKPKYGSIDSFIYNDAVIRVKNGEFRNLNFTEVKSIAHIIAPLFGPNGLTVLIKKDSNNYRITQKGYEIASTFTNKLPVVKILKKLVNSQQKNCGDGTKTVLLMTGLLIEKAQSLMEQGINAQIINKGYNLGMNIALEILDKYSILLTNRNNEIDGINGREWNNDCLIKLIYSIFTNKISSEVVHHFLSLILRIVKDPKFLTAELNKFDFSNIFYRKIPGKSMLESELIHGFIIYKDKLDYLTPDSVTNPKIVLIQASIDYFSDENHKLSFCSEIEDAETYREFSTFQQEFYKKLAISFKEKGINVILCQKKCNEDFLNSCAALGIIAFDMVGEQEIKSMAKMLNVGLIGNINDISYNNIGIADLAEFRKLSNDQMLFIEKHDSPILTFLFRGGSNHVFDELKEMVETSIQVALQSMEDKKVLPSGGAIESEISYQIQKISNSYSSALQLVLYEYAKIFESLIGYIVINSGEDPLYIIPTLISDHAKKMNFNGFDANSKCIVDVMKCGIFEGYYTKKHAIKISTECARQIIRIDDLIMVYDRGLYDQIREVGKQGKMDKRNEQLRCYFKKHETDFIP